MKKTMLKTIGIILSVCVILSTICGAVIAQTDNTYYSYTQTYDDSSVFAADYQHYGFSVVDGKLVSDVNPHTIYGYRVTLNPSQSAALTSGKTYRIEFDYSSTTNFSLTTRNPFFPGDSTNVIGMIDTEYSTKETNSTDKNGRFYATFTATHPYIILRQYSGSYIDITIDNLKISEVIPTVTATSEDESKGTVTVANKNASLTNFVCGDTAVFTATAKDGYVFEGWYNGDTKIENAGATYEMQLSDVTELTAKFTEAPYYELATNYQSYVANNTLGGTAGGTAPTVDLTTAHTTGGSSIKFSGNMHGKVAAFKLDGIEVGKAYKLSLWFTGTPTATRTPNTYDFLTPGVYVNGTTVGSNGVLGANIAVGSDVSYIADANWYNSVITFTASSTDLYFAVRVWCCNNLWIDDVVVEKMINVTVNTNNGEENDILTGLTGDALTLTRPAKDGYTFAGWYTDTALTNEFSGTTFPDSDITLYAKWVDGITQDFEDYKLNAVGEGVSVAESDNNKYLSFIPNDNETATNQAADSNKHRANVLDLSTYLTNGQQFKLTFKYKTSATDANIAIKNSPSNPWSAATNSYNILASDGTVKTYSWGENLSNTNGEWQEFSKTLIYVADSTNKYLSIWFGATAEVAFDDITVLKLATIETAHNNKAAIMTAEASQNGKQGVRIYNKIDKAFVAQNVKEFGSIAIREGFLKSVYKYVNGSELTLTSTEDIENAFTVDLRDNYAAKDSKYSTAPGYGLGVSWDKDDAENAKLWSEDSTSYEYTAFLTGIEPKFYSDIYFIRTYATLNDGTTAYGDIQELCIYDQVYSILEIAKETEGDGYDAAQAIIEQAIEADAKDSSIITYAEWLSAKN